MPHDFGSIGSQDHRSGSGLGSGIGFHELRQACEISALREDLERIANETGALRDSVEEAVEQIRDRFAALSASELSDANAMAPLLQFAVTTLLDIREQTRRLNTRSGPVADDERSSWGGTADAPRARPTPSATPETVAAPVVMVEGPPRLAPPSPPTTTPTPTPPAAPAKAMDEKHSGVLSSQKIKPEEALRPASSPPASPPAPSASWLTSKDAPPAPPTRAATARHTGSIGKPVGGIDWLGPAGR